MNELSIILPIAVTIVLGLLGFLMKDALKARDVRLDKLEEDVDGLRVDMTTIQVTLSRIAERNELLLDHARRTTDKVDRILAELNK